ncbi:sarcosine oxidase [Singulisphaera sp. GP187]|uniref:N-methyl-L-tryptophan oxidase n=1 Tax=Singulisphaera sp. GP187 TaxID=1882752 RepID=UPI00092792F1|nr:N-methyl-L-tryptophan oxidase [Singulisphaera sp. GP187]SIO46067.1 sarcosine oxidase [Singulisphaera sp. GP187]
MEQRHARNVIIGSGAMGAATAYHLAKRGEPVLLLEQFAIGHDRGSSHGVARITRHSYADPRYARLMLDAFRAWKDLEADAGQNLYLRTGGLSFCPPEVDYVSQVAASLQAIEIPHRRMSGRELRRSFPVFELPENYDVVFEPDAGLIAAARAIAAQLELARQFGGDRTQVLAECPVRSIDLEGNKPIVITDHHRISADRLIVTAGAWAGRLLPNFPVTLRPTRQQVLYLRPQDPHLFAPGRFPVFIHKGAGPLDDFYGMPEYQGQGVKLARHGGPDVDPDVEDRRIEEPYLEVIRHFLTQTIPMLVNAPIEQTEVCLYTTTPDEHFRLGIPPDCPNLVIASPCSGHGFKFSCLIGRILADLATQGTTEIAIAPWQL